MYVWEEAECFMLRDAAGKMSAFHFPRNENFLFGRIQNNETISLNYQLSLSMSNNPTHIRMLKPQGGKIDCQIAWAFAYGFSPSIKLQW